MTAPAITTVTPAVQTKPDSALPETNAVPSSKAPLSPSQIAIVKATVPVLKVHGNTIAALFYKNMITAHPELNNVFSTTSQTTGAQPRALATAVLAYATYIDDLPKLRGAVERIAQKHVSLHIIPEQYDIVGQYLIEAIGLVLGDAATPEIVDAWTAAYGVLAQVFIGREQELYKAHENWIGWRKFKILRKEKEADTIASFYLAPVDGAALPSFKPGQYVSLQVFVRKLGYLQSRQYSLSKGPAEDGSYYRVSVKREHDDTLEMDGLISNMLHDSYEAGDEVELSHPHGEFLLDPTDSSKQGAPVVLISAGVGATPLMSILDTLTQQQPSASRPISWIHTSRSKSAQPFAAEVESIAAHNKDRLATHVWLREKKEEEEEEEGNTGEAGVVQQRPRLDLLRLDRDGELFVHDKRAEYYICGPEGFMSEMRRALLGLGVDKERIYRELFETGDVKDE